MGIGKDCAIFMAINSDKYTDEEKVAAIRNVMEMPTHNGINKDAMLEVIKYALRRTTPESKALTVEASINCARSAELIKRDTAMVCDVQTVNRGLDISGEYDIDSDLMCPACGVVVGDAESNELYGGFCSHCGQRLTTPPEED